ncbi:MAG: hypothetical protein DHS20C05_25770 [Hyphococcus sp.]|nr:MAG: hypothetical protein DHS20C05_25770 [Marinicaulis sp.]
MTEAEQQKVLTCIKGALATSERFESPYTHWVLSELLPTSILQDVQQLKFPTPDLGGVSGKRELHNDQRHYFDQANIKKHPSISTLSHAFQASAMVKTLQDFFAIDLEGTYLRFEYAQDVTGFWLEPHTDLGVKKLTVLIYISDNVGHDQLGTDIFNTDKSWAKRSPFAPNMAMAFVPGDNTYHGFQTREINGVRKSLILNYVTDAWRDREQLAFPNEAVSAK